MKCRLPRRLTVVTLTLFLSLVTAQACGPEFFPDVFVHKLRPDKPKEFAQGKLGLVPPTFPRADLIVAYRYLNGGTLSPAEQHAYQPTEFPSDTGPEELEQSSTEPAPVPAPADVWAKLREHYAASTPPVNPIREKSEPQSGGWSLTVNYENCNANAFETAAATLRARSKTWGEKSPDLVDWIKGQDAVFADCSSRQPILPAAAPANSSTLLKGDRSYQLAAANFYIGDLIKARQQFEAIAQDSNSPWHGIAGYLAARCLVRQAFAIPSPNGEDMAKFDPAMMREAASILKALLKQKPSGISQHAIQSELNFVRLRIEAMARLRELSAALAGPQTDHDYDQHLQDLTWYLNVRLDNKAVREDSGYFDQLPDSGQPNSVASSDDRRATGFSEVYRDLASVRGSSPLVDWLITYQSPAKETAAHAVEKWQATHEAPWLLAAIAKAESQTKDLPDLLKAAEQTSPDSPAWESITYHRIRLLIALGRAEEARTLLNQVMPQIVAGGRDSSINAFTGLRMAAAPDLKQLLAFAPRKILIRSSQSQSALGECLEVMKNPKRVYDCKAENSPTQFSEDAASFFNTEVPLSTLVDVAESDALPQSLRRSVTLMAWVRSVLLKDDAAAARLYPLLPEKLKQQSGSSTGFPAVVTLVRNPGLRPYLDPGVQRSYSYDFVESYADNWWCLNSDAFAFSDHRTPLLKQTVSFLTPDQQAEGEKQASEIVQQGRAESYLGEQILAYASAHPDDPDVPESIYLTLRMIRYGCDRFSQPAAENKQVQNKETIQKAAARLLRQRYPASPWTKKAAPLVR